MYEVFFLIKSYKHQNNCRYIWGVNSVRNIRLSKVQMYIWSSCNCPADGAVDSNLTPTPPHSAPRSQAHLHKTTGRGKVRATLKATVDNPPPPIGLVSVACARLAQNLQYTHDASASCWLVRLHPRIVRGKFNRIHGEAGCYLPWLYL